MTFVLGNSLLNYGTALVTFFGLLIIFSLLQRIILRWAARLASRTRTGFDDVVIRVLQTIKPPFYSFIAFYLALRVLALDPLIERILYIALVCWVSLQVVLALQVGVQSLFQRRLKSEEHASHKSVLEVLSGVVKFVLWILGLLFVLSNLGVNITSLVAGLGIGGIAIALASQNILSDLFNSLVLYFDQPFFPGDFIEVGGDKGTVLKIGVKTTRIRSLGGEEIIVPNKDIAAARVKNYRRLEERRISFLLAIDRVAGMDHFKQVPELIAEVVKAVPHTRFSRAHAHELKADSVVFEVVYYVTDSEYDAYMDAHQLVLLGIIDSFGKAGIKASSAA